MLSNYYNRFIKRLESPAAQRRDQLAFLPAALEVQETPPSPIGRAITWAVILLFTLAVIWASLGKIDIVAVATGKVIPSARVKTIQPLEIAVVSAIHVEEGQAVKQGDLLITLDSTQTQADQQRLAKELRAAQTEWVRSQALQQLLEQHEAPASIATLLEHVASTQAVTLSAQELTFQARLLQSQWQEYQSRRSSLQGQQRARESEQRQAQSLKTKLQRTLPLISERAGSIETLYQKQLASREQYLALEQERIAQEQDLLAETARVDQLGGEVEQIQQQIAALDSEYQRNNLMTIQQAKQQVVALEQEWIKARQRNQQQTLSAPIDGTVQQLSIHTVGGVVTPAQELMWIVPEDSRLEVQAFIQNKDIGFVAEGQAAEVKVDTFNFTKFGVIDAELSNISSDAVSDEALGLVYPARVLLHKASIKVADKWVNLSPGMAVTVEVKTGKRRIIEFFLSPLLRYKQESIRER